MPCSQWGYVLEGRLTLRFADHEEVFEAGDAFYAPAGHARVHHDPGTEVVMVSGDEELAKTEAVMERNMQRCRPADRARASRRPPGRRGARRSPCWKGRAPAAAGPRPRAA